MHTHGDVFYKEKHGVFFNILVGIQRHAVHCDILFRLTTAFPVPPPTLVPIFFSQIVQHSTFNTHTHTHMRMHTHVHTHICTYIHCPFVPLSTHISPSHCSPLSISFPTHKHTNMCVHLNLDSVDETFVFLNLTYCIYQNDFQFNTFPCDDIILFFTVE